MSDSVDFSNVIARAFALLAIAAVVIAGNAAFAAADVFDAIRKRGHINCGVSAGAVGFSRKDDSGRWAGMNVDLCRALAVVSFGDETKVRFVPVPSTRRFAALQDGEIDILARMTAWTLSRDLDQTTKFVAPFYYGSYGFLTRKSNGLTSALELTGATVCVLAGSKAEQAVQEFFARYGMKFQPVRLETWAGVSEAYEKGSCLVLVAERVTLADARNGMKDGQDHALLPESTSIEAFGPVVAAGQERWARCVRWTIYSLIAAENFGIAQKNVESAWERKLPVSAAGHLISIEAIASAALELRKGWLYDVIRLVGNYGDIYDRNIGAKTPLLLTRGKNALARNGGLLLAPSFR